MKWKQSLALVLTVGMLLCACGGQSSSQTGEGASSQSVPQSVSGTTQADSQAASSAPTADRVEATPLTVQKQKTGLYQWDDIDLLAQTEYSRITLWWESAAGHPQLAQTLEQTAAMAKRGMEDEYDNLCAFAAEELATTGDGFETWVSTLDTQLRRADSVAVSVLSDSYADYGWIEDYRGMHGTAYDTQTGRQLALTDVVKEVNQDLAEAVADELNRHQWAGDYDFTAGVEEYFANTPYDGISWTLDYNGVTFYFADGDLTEPGEGRQTATVAFAQYPELFREKYTAVPDAYMVELPLDQSYFTDLDDDGTLDELQITGYYSSDVGSYTQYGVYTDGQGSFRYEECYADGFEPYYVKTADDHPYLYLFCALEEGPFPTASLIVMDLSGGMVTPVDTMNAGPGYIPDGIYRLPTDPACFYLDDFDGMAQDSMPYCVGADGMPQPLQ